MKISGRVEPEKVLEIKIRADSQIGSTACSMVSTGENWNPCPDADSGNWDTTHMSGDQPAWLEESLMMSEHPPCFIALCYRE